jgi:hypothetical protein
MTAARLPDKLDEERLLMANPDNLPEPAEGQALQRAPLRVLAPGVDAGFVTAPEEPKHPLMAGWQPAPPPAQGFSPPVFGALSVIFGVTAFYKATLILGPLALIAGLIACLRKQWGWGLIGILSALAALAIDPYFWGLAGVLWLARVLGLLG